MALKICHACSCEIVSGVQRSCAVRTGATRGMVFVCHMHQFAGYVFIAEFTAGFVSGFVAGFVCHCESDTNSARASVHCRPDSE